MKKGFGLLEIFIIIGVFIVAVALLAFIVKPGKILEKSQDAERIEEIENLKTAINLYIADNHDFSALSSRKEYKSTATNNASLADRVDGRGWIPLDFSVIKPITPIKKLPLEPDRASGFYYSFGVDKAAKTFEINCILEGESGKLKQRKDGGNNSERYEIGTDLSILP